MAPPKPLNSTGDGDMRDDLFGEGVGSLRLGCSTSSSWWVSDCVGGRASVGSRILTCLLGRDTGAERPVRAMVDAEAMNAFNSLGKAVKSSDAHLPSASLPPA